MGTWNETLNVENVKCSEVLILIIGSYIHWQTCVSNIFFQIMKVFSCSSRNHIQSTNLSCRSLNLIMDNLNRLVNSNRHITNGIAKILCQV